MSKLSKIAIVILFTVNFLNAQSAIVVAGGESNRISYTIGSDLIKMQITEEQEEVVLGIPKYDIEQPTKSPSVKKKKNILEIIIEAILKIFKK